MTCKREAGLRVGGGVLDAPENGRFVNRPYNGSEAL